MSQKKITGFEEIRALVMAVLEPDISTTKIIERIGRLYYGAV